ncbi:hypothetical protein PSTG_05225 [Puccinia striiformis f. sp. tritici PST-78]|uniref:Uncharacterized protein n=1 Tax=Puccinia striiformis f. sp. tritici PST-78 TaxID=1165861 RepID=A0A0L0VQ94_9BASI|nr:hypothetical protein PSTG_05225 [Puccinia striiformis f. sp. tritici PST-78]
MTPVENQNLIQHYLTIVKQQRADNPPPPPFVDPLTSNERLDRIIKNVLADQEAELDHKIFLNQSLREYRKDKKMEAIARRDSIYEFMIHLTSELLKDPRPTLHSRDFDAALFKRKFEKLEKILSNDKNNPLYTQNLATFNIRFERYQEALIQAQEIEVQATQTKDKTVIPTTKVLKIEHQSAPIDKLPSPIPKVTGNFHLDKHLAKTSITDKLANKKEKITKKKTLPLESTLGDSSISSFTTEPYFEDLEPTTRLPSPFLKKITLKKELPVITDSENEEDQVVEIWQSPRRTDFPGKHSSRTPKGSPPPQPKGLTSPGLQRLGFLGIQCVTRWQDIVSDRVQRSKAGHHNDNYVSVAAPEPNRQEDRKPPELNRKTATPQRYKLVLSRTMQKLLQDAQVQEIKQITHSRQQKFRRESTRAEALISRKRGRRDLYAEVQRETVG